jgi:hypothetical protein
MTAAQRATLERVLVQADKGLFSDAVADALRAALGTCGNCQHLGEQDEGQGFCAAPPGVAGFPFLHYLMPLGERCTGWTAKEGA